MKAVALLLLGLALVSAYTEQEYRDAFTSWMGQHQRSYSSAEFQTRYGIFKNNMDYIQQWNAQNTLTRLGTNQFADLTNEEYQRIYLGTKIDAPTPQAVPQRVRSYTATVDWRTKNAVTPIKNQGQCGSCWSFSTTGSTEGAHALSTGNLVSLSEQNLVDCTYQVAPYNLSGCDGGLMTVAFQYIINNKGIDTEASYPYQGVVGKCHYNPSNSAATLSSFNNVTSGSEADLETAANQQPVSVAIDASHMSFQLYTSGIYHEIFCSATKLDHGVLVVGYGTDTDNNANYWIVKNSWGTSWGQDGYIYMSKDRNNNCGIATMASYPIV
jgi:cathepsin L